LTTIFPANRSIKRKQRRSWKRQDLLWKRQRQLCRQLNRLTLLQVRLYVATSQF